MSAEISLSKGPRRGYKPNKGRGTKAVEMIRAVVVLAVVQAVSCFVFQKVGLPAEAKYQAFRCGIEGRQFSALRTFKRVNQVQQTRCQLKFVDAVSELLKRQYKEENVKRVLESWYRMDQDYLHRERVEELDTWQEANSYISGLGIKTFYDPYEFEWARGLRDNAKTIQDEFRRVALLGADDLERTGNNVWATAANATSAAAYGPSWKTLALMDRCVWDDVNTALFPETTRLLRALEVPCLEAFFARMTPRSHIGAHSDYCNFALTAHLGLDVPEGQCWITVGGERREWRKGEMLMFDTSIFHEATNEADRFRYVLMLRVFHHELTPTETLAIRRIFSYLDDVELLERDIVTIAPDLLPGAPKPAPTPAPALRSPAPVGGSGAGTANRAARRGHKAAAPGAAKADARAKAAAGRR